MTTAAQLIEHLALAPHPEGGWYRQTWRAAAAPGERPTGTAILFLLEAGQSSHWHKVDAVEIWLWHAGDPILLELSAADNGPVEKVILGADVLGGQEVQQIIPKDCWQAARPVAGGTAGYALVSCTVSPGFDFAGFTLAAPGWSPGS